MGSSPIIPTKNKSMHIDILTCVPDIFRSPFENSIMKRAIDANVLDLKIHNLRDFSLDKHKKVDDAAYGPNAGMVMTIEPIHRCISSLKQQRDYDEVIYMSPDGILLDQHVANDLSLKKNLIILCGHYKGVDERVREHLITKEISIGDYVLSGGELPACVLIDTIVRVIPGVLSDETSALTDSFQDNLIAPPVYTKPKIYNGWTVPEILLCGNDKKIQEWQFEESLKRTKERRSYLLNED